MPSCSHTLGDYIMRFGDFEQMRFRGDFCASSWFCIEWTLLEPWDRVNVLCMWHRCECLGGRRWSMIDWILPHPRCPWASPQNLWMYYIAKEALQIWLKWWTMRWGDYRGLSGWAQSHHTGLIKLRRRQKSQSEKHHKRCRENMTEAEVRDERMTPRAVTGFEDGEQGHEPRVGTEGL